MLYDINDTSRDVARSHMKASDKARFRIVMEIAKGCYGNCEGCSLSAIDRKNSLPAMSITQVQDTLKYFIPLIHKKTHLTTSVINLGVGDYFMLSNEYLEELFKSIHDFFLELSTPRKLITLSTSLFSTPDKMREKIEAITKYLNPNQFAIDVVLDPFRMEKQYSRYFDNIKYLTQTFPFVDFVINLSNNIQVSQIDSLIDFLKKSNILNIDIQYAINNTNSYRVKIEPSKFKEFMTYFYDNFPEEIMNLSIAQAEVSGETNIFEEMEKNAQEIISERLFVNEQGEIFPIAYGLGDIILDERYHFSSIGNIYTPFDEVKATEQIAQELKKIFIKTKVCQTCEHNKKCYATGYAFYNKFTSNPKVCDNLGRYYFEK